MVTYDKKALQAMFERAWHGVSDQGRPAVDSNGNCIYWDFKTDCACAIGHMLSPADAAQLERSFGGIGVADLKDNSRKEWRQLVPAEFKRLIDNEVSFPERLSGFNALRDIQYAHDSCAGTWHQMQRNGSSKYDFVAEFQDSMRCVADDYGLTIPD